MPNENTTFEISKQILSYATEAVGWQLDEVEHDMRNQPDRYAEYTNARKCIAAEEAN